MEKKIYPACTTLLDVCAKCKKDEKILIVTDSDSLIIAQALWDAAEDYPNKSLIMMPTQTMHGQEPTALVAAAMMEADVIFRPTTFSISSTEAKRNACAKGARDINCSDYDLRMLESGGLYADFEAIGPVLDRVAELYQGNDIEIMTPMGTHITANITGRSNLPQYGRSIVPGQASSPPDIECAIGANRGTMNGIAYIDGSIPHPKLGLITEPIKLTVKKSIIVKIEGGKQARILSDILAAYNDPKVYHIGEIGIGMNPACELTGRMLEDEGCNGTVHFGIGDDRGFGGDVNCPIHLDAVFCNPTLSVDGKVLLRDGKLTV
jgi:leucyl aminopeptidase (aminopeptidase T)